MKNYSSSIKLFFLYLLLLLFSINCAGSLTEMAADQDTVIKSYKEQIDYGLTWKAAMENIEKVKGKVVKWDGALVRIWEDKIQVYGRGREESINNFIVKLDHPILTEAGIGDMTQTVSIGKTVWVVGRIIDKEEFVTRRGVNVTVPVLRGLMVSKDNDRNFARPVWIANE